MGLERFRLDGQCALVTGGSKGLGRAMAKALASAGADIVVTSRHLAEAQESADEIETMGRGALACEADVTDREAVTETVRRAVERFGKIDILLNNAGINIRKPTIEVGDAEWDPVVDITLKGSLYCSQAVVPGMIERKYGRIINLGSIMSSVSIAHRAAYTSAKHGVLGLTKALALEWAPHGITVNCICPGPFGTPMNRKIMDDPEVRQFFVSRIPMGRWGEPEELETTILYLAAPGSGFITGAAVYVDGGWTAQ